MAPIQSRGFETGTIAPDKECGSSDKQYLEHRAMTTFARTPYSKSSGLPQAHALRLFQSPTISVELVLHSNLTRNRELLQYPDETAHNTMAAAPRCSFTFPGDRLPNFLRAGEALRRCQARQERSLRTSHASCRGLLA